MNENYEIDIIDENEVEVLDRGYDENNYEESNEGGLIKGLLVGSALTAAIVGGVHLYRKSTAKKREEKQIKELESKGYRISKIEPTEAEVDEVVEEAEAEEKSDK